LVRGPTLRDGADLLELLANLGYRLGNNVAFFMKNADFDVALAAALDLSTYSRHEHRATANGFSVVLFIVKSSVEVSPVVDEGDEGDEVGHQSA
jgi:hypothetical protein